MFNRFNRFLNIRKSFTYIRQQPQFNKYYLDNIRMVSGTKDISYIDKIYEYSARSDHKTSLNDLVNLQTYKEDDKINYVHNALKIKIAKKLVEIETFPNGLSQMESIKKVEGWYMQSFKDLITIDNNLDTSLIDKQLYSKTLQDIYDRHSSTMITMSKGIFEWKQMIENKYHIGNNGDNVAFFRQTHNRLISPVEIALTKFYQGRISIRLLLEHYLELSRGDHNIETDNKQSNIATSQQYVGIINMKCKPINIIKEVYMDIVYMTEREYGRSPTLHINNFPIDHKYLDELNFDITIPYVSSNLYYALFEVLKNSSRAIMESQRKNINLSPIKIVIPEIVVPGSTYIIKISDHGDGIHFNDLDNVWSFFYTTSKKNIYTLNNTDQFDDFGKNAPIAGFGHGLPISRLYLRYFGGDLRINSIKDNGTDVYLYI